MKTWVVGVFLAVAVLVMLISGTAQAQVPNAGCTTNTLFGDYAFTVSGQIYAPDGTVAQQRDGVAMTHFDGAGHLTQVDFVTSNGVPLSGPTDSAGFHTKETGTYIVFPDCTGAAEIDMPAPPGLSSGAVINLMFVLGNHGLTIHTVVSQLIPPGSTTPVPASIHSDAEKLGQVTGVRD
ncbi:MAG TPA: hypothetical protein VLW84_02715 [Terriglobales bacterium]|nr:hypothetical protein [Terriglobales bacterium]